MAKTMTQNDVHYWQRRIEETFNSKIKGLKILHAREIEKMKETEWENFLLALGIKDDYLELEDIDKESKKIIKSLIAVIDELKKDAQRKGWSTYRYENHNTNNFKGIQDTLIEHSAKFARIKFYETPNGKEIALLEARKKWALDLLHGTDDKDSVINKLHDIIMDKAQLALMAGDIKGNLVTEHITGIVDDIAERE